MVSTAHRNQLKVGYPGIRQSSIREIGAFAFAAFCLPGANFSLSFRSRQGTAHVRASSSAVSSSGMSNITAWPLGSSVCHQPRSAATG